MNVIVANDALNVLSELDIDLLKSVTGVHEADEIVSMFKNFFFNKMILDITAIKDYSNVENIQKLSINLDASKIILYLPNDPIVNSNTFLSKLVAMGFYNFTTNLDGVKYLLEHTNTYKDVAHIQNIDTGVSNEQPASAAKIIGVKNLTDHSGATTLVYMMHQEAKRNGLKSYSVEVNKRDFSFYNDMYMKSISDDELGEEILKYKDASVVFVDLNDSKNIDVCTEVLYLLESSVVKLNRLTLRDKNVFSRMKGKKVVLNINTLKQDDINSLEFEAKISFYVTLPALSDRDENIEIKQLLNKLGVISNVSEKSDEKKSINNLFGIFKND